MSMCNSVLNIQVKKDNTMNIYVGNLSRDVTEDDVKIAENSFFCDYCEKRL